MSPELASESALTMTFDIPSNRVEARVVLKNMGLPMYLLEKATAKIDIQPSATASEEAIQVDWQTDSLKLHLMLENKGMTDATNISLVAKLEDLSS